MRKYKLVAVGGMIGAGKTTLIDKLANQEIIEVVREIDQSDKLTQIMLDWHQGSKSPTATTKFQIHFLTTCFLNHRNALFSLNPQTQFACLDRTIIEHYLFAKHYKSIDLDVYNCMWKPAWKHYINLLREYDQLPDVYYLLDAKISVLFERLIIRNRKAEVENYQQMISSFVRLATLYIPKMKEILEELKIDYKVIETSKLNCDEVFKLVYSDLTKRKAKK